MEKVAKMAKVKEKSQAMQTRNKQTHDKAVIFLEVYAKLGNVSHACKAIGMSRQFYHVHMREESFIVNWRGEDVEFKKAVKDAYEEAIDGMEEEALRRATVGTQELVLHQGKPVKVEQLDADGNPTGKMVNYTRSKVSDLLLIFLLKGARPDKYADHRTVTQTGSIEHIHRGIRDLPPDQQHERMNEYIANYQRMLGIGKN
jgi:hypothetical protein